MFNLQDYEYFEDINLGLLKYMPHGGKLILDVGCGNGLMGQINRKNHNVVYGIEYAPVMKNIALKRLNKFFSEDVTDFKRCKQLLKKYRFDVIVFADVLEHLYDPVGIVNFYKKFLKKDGRIIISVPNIAVWYARIWLLLGRFNYMTCGTLDKTHIRFFTKKNLLLLAQYSGLEKEKLDITPGIARFPLLYFRDFFKGKGKGINRRGIIDTPYYNFYVKFIYPLEYWFCRLRPEIFAFQYIGVFKKKISTNHRLVVN
ncbi:class I SAM-dependent methyltransferase [Candidatus Microgenomates bacterium]|nr:class I SAM-dependent methyltransferase [Candidatus Microgenomates bacterium]